MSTPIKSAPSTPAVAPRSSRNVWLFLLALLVLGAGGALWFGRGSSANVAHKGRGAAANEEGAGAEGNPATAQAPAGSDERVRVEVVRPRKGGLTRTSSQVGSVEPFEQANLYAKVSGYLKSQQVDIGSRVKKGEVLAVIDDPEVIKEADRAAAALAQAKAMVAQAQAKVETALADAKAAKAAVARAQADIASYTSKRKYRQKELSRYRDLRERGAVPQQVVDEYEDHFETAVAQERSAEAEQASAQALAEAAQAKVDQAKADLAEARSNVEVAAETLARDRVLVEYTRIVSPYDGVITLRNFFVGDFIRSAAEGNERPLLTAARADKMRVVTYVPDRDVPFTDVGDKAIVTLDALPGQKFEGKVARFSHKELAESRTMRTEIDLENPKNLLREGMYGIATIILEPDTPNLTVPSNCLIGKSVEGKSSLYVVRDGKAHEVSVLVGTDNGIRVEILRGISPEDLVITSKGLVSEGLPVVVAGETKAASASAGPPRRRASSPA